MGLAVIIQCLLCHHITSAHPPSSSCIVSLTSQHLRSPTSSPSPFPAALLPLLPPCRAGWRLANSSDVVSEASHWVLAPGEGESAFGIMAQRGKTQREPETDEGQAQREGKN